MGYRNKPPKKLVKKKKLTGWKGAEFRALQGRKSHRNRPSSLREGLLLVLTLMAPRTRGQEEKWLLLGGSHRNPCPPTR